MASFWKPEACGQTVLPDRSVLMGHKLVENAKIPKFKCDIWSNFQTMWKQRKLCFQQYELCFEETKAMCRVSYGPSKDQRVTCLTSWHWRRHFSVHYSKISPKRVDIVLISLFFLQWKYDFQSKNHRLITFLLFEFSRQKWQKSKLCIFEFFSLWNCMHNHTVPEVHFCPKK